MMLSRPCMYNEGKANVRVWFVDHEWKILCKELEENQRLRNQRQSTRKGYR